LLSDAGKYPSITRITGCQFNWTAKSFDKILNAVDDSWVRHRPHGTNTLKTAA
jgi:hypothetical protein